MFHQLHISRMNMESDKTGYL